MKLFKKFATAFLAIALMVSLLVPVQAFASEPDVQEQQVETEPRIALGWFNFKGSSKTTVVLHGGGFDTGDIQTVEGSVKITVGSRSKSYPFKESVPGLYSKDFGSWYLTGWTSAELEWYYFNYSDGTTGNKIYPEDIKISNDF